MTYQPHCKTYAGSVKCEALLAIVIQLHLRLQALLCSALECLIAGPLAARTLMETMLTYGNIIEQQLITIFGE
jgi:hypothetical protein